MAVQTVPDSEQHVVPVVPLELRIYSHSMFFYWWPVWLTGFIMALLTRVQGIQVQVGDGVEWYHPSKNLGVVFVAVLVTVILFTNVSLRGKASVIAILGVLCVTLLLAYFDWWDPILRLIPHLSIRMNLGFHLFIATVLFAAWLFTVFVYDRLSYWRIRPGQMIFESVIGGGEKSYDTRGMVFEKRYQDFFRNWILGFGSGDLNIITVGARAEQFVIPNVLFVNQKVAAIQRLIALRPEVTTEVVT
jgi:hypothetical protein